MIYDTDITLEERFNRLLVGPGNYRVRDGVIYTKILEINASRHCNLFCRSCSHSSPVLKKENMEKRVFL